MLHQTPGSLLREISYKPPSFDVTPLIEQKTSGKYIYLVMILSLGFWSTRFSGITVPQSFLTFF